MFFKQIFSKVKSANFVSEDKSMRSWQWKKIIGLGLSIFVLSVSSVGLTGCDVAEEGEGLEQEEDD
jgi:hypothetical protein